MNLFHLGKGKVTTQLFLEHIRDLYTMAEVVSVRALRMQVNEISFSRKMPSLRRTWAEPSLAEGYAWADCTAPEVLKMPAIRARGARCNRELPTEEAGLAK
jgi:hypothetical protein